MIKKYLLALALPIALLAGCNQSGVNTANDESTSAASSRVAEEHTHETDGAPTTKLEFITEPGELAVGKEATWTLKISDIKSGEPIQDFAIVHDKKMHLIVVKKDLTWFNHIHPEYDGNGVFTVKETLPSAGTYKIYVDLMPEGGTGEVLQHEFATDGQSPQPVEVNLTPDKMKGAWMTKKVIAHPESMPNATGGATYEVALMPMPTPVVAGEDMMLHFQVRDAQGNPIKDLQPYLGAMGHAVILSKDSKEYLHSHPMAEGEEHDMSKMGEMDMSKMDAAPVPESGGPDVMFHTNFPSAGLYKAWGQFQHKGQIITADFVLNVKAPKADATTNQSNSHSH